MISRICWRLAEMLSRLLEPRERDASLGDLAESGGSGAQVLRDVFGLVARRQVEQWKKPRLWIPLLLVVVPLGLLLRVVSSESAAGSSITLWLYLNNWDWTLFEDVAFRQGLAHYSSELLLGFLVLACWSWTVGLAAGILARGAGLLNAVLLASIVFMDSGRHNYAQVHAAVFAVTFYRVIFPPLVKVLLVSVPALFGMRIAARLRAHSSPLRNAALVTLGLIVFVNWIDWRFPVLPAPAKSRWLAARSRQSGRLLASLFIGSRAPSGVPSSRRAPHEHLSLSHNCRRTRWICHRCRSSRPGPRRHHTGQ